MSIDIITADAVKWAEEYDGPLFHALFCDAPYHLTTITKRFGKEGSAPAQFGKDGAYARASRGFMGTQWDGGDLAFRPETWYAFGKVLYPGAFGIAYASSRGYHRMAVAIEDAGFVIHPSIFLWLNAQSFPKATRIDTKISDTDLAKAWVGHRYGGQVLSNCAEPIIVFQKPYEGRPLDCITQTGAGALNVDAARIPSAEPYTINTWDDNAHPFGDGAGNPYTSRQESGGRWPKNFILDEAAAEVLDRQAGVRKSGSRKKSHQVGKTGENGNMPHLIKARPFQSESDGWQGNASEFFYKVQNQLDEADPIYYCPKVSPTERNAGCNDLPKKASLKLAGADRNTRPNANNDVSDRLETNPQQNFHPTLKPIQLNEYLAKLLLPPALYAPRRLFNPFAGVSSEAIGAALAGWEEVVAVEWLAEYTEIGKRRVAYWLNKPRQLNMLER